MTPNRRELLLAYRWPLAVVISSLVMAAAVAGFAEVVVRLLSRPIPIAIGGGLQVDRLVLPPTVTIRATTALPVTVTDPVPVLTARPLAIRGPLAIQGDVRAKAQLSGIDTPVAIEPVKVEPITVEGQVTLKEPVRLRGPVTVDGEVKAKIRL